MGTSSLTDQHIAAVGLLAKGLDLRQIAQEMNDEVNVRNLLVEVGLEWGVRYTSPLVVAFADHLTANTRRQWVEWAESNFTHLHEASDRQGRLLKALALKSNASLTLAELASVLGTDEDTLSGDLKELLAQLPGVSTRAGLTMICYLTRLWSQPPTSSVKSAPKPKQDLGSADQKFLRLVARGLSNAEIQAELKLTSVDPVKTYLRRLFRQLGARNRLELALMYIRQYQPAEEREQWRREITFRWPQGRPRDVLMLLLSTEHCGATNAAIGKRLHITEDTVKTHFRRLISRADWPQNRTSLAVAAELHR